MSDNMYGNDFYFEAEPEVKQEQMFDSNSTTASLPIPAKRTTELSDLRDFNVEFERLQQDLCGQDVGMSIFQNNFFKYNMDGDSNSKSETFKMDDDDIFQVDKADLIQGPTLAELNANDETFLGDLNFDGLELPEEGSFYLQLLSGSPRRERESTPALRVQPPCVGYRDVGAFSPCSSVDTGSQQGSPGLGLHELLSPQTYTIPTMLSSSLQKNLAQTRLSSSAPTHLTSEQVWARREPRKHLLSTGSLAEAGSTSSLSTGGVLSPRTNDDLSQDEDSDDDSDKYEDFSSEDDDDDLDSKPLKSRHLSKQEKFFWQYNLQAKGPKGQRLVLKSRLEDPHVLNKVTDPVFSPNCSVRGIKHSGKARKGDGNDLTPNPKKLCAIGKELDSLGRIINDMTPVSELPFNVRPKTRKEKNKLASRACRLKKKAQHEANKLKLYGLEHEHKRLLNGISQLKNVIATVVTSPDSQDTEATLDKVVKTATKVKIAGHSSEFVNRVLEKVKAGVPGGGLNEF